MLDGAPRWVLPLLASVLSFGVAALVARQWASRRRPYQLVWAIGLAWYGMATGAEALGYAVGWSQPVYRAWYFFGAMLVAAYLGLGEVYLLRETRFGYLAAGGVLAGSLPAWLAASRLAAGGRADALLPVLGIGLAGVAAAALIALAQRWRPRLVGHVAAGCLVAGTLASAAAVFGAAVDPALMVDPATGVVHGRAIPETLRLATPLFNVAGALALVLGAASSGWQGWRHGAAPHRAASNALIALGGLIPGVTSSLGRLGSPGTAALGELAGVVCIFAGFLVSTEVFAWRARAATPRSGARPAAA